MKKLSCFSILLLFIFNVYAQNEEIHPIDVELDQCLEKSENYTTNGMIDCFVKARNSWESELNKDYSLLLIGLTSEQGELLKAAQNQWIKLRDSENEFSDLYINSLGGTLSAIEAASNKATIIKNRVLDLKYYLSLNSSNEK